VTVGPAPIEAYLRDSYFQARIDISSSGVENFTFEALRRHAGLELPELDGVLLADSHALGGPALREAIARRWGAGDPDGVMVTHGSSEALFLAFSHLTRPGDEVVVPSPCYPQLELIAAGRGARIVRWPLRPEEGFRPSLDELRRLVGPRTRIVVANFPHNPTGVTLTGAEQATVVGVAKEAGAYVLWDAAFGDLVYDPACRLANPATDHPHVLCLGTLSKAYGLPGLRIGWCFGPPDVLRGMVALRDHVTICLSPLVELVARRAVERADALLAPRLAQARINRDVVGAWLAEHADAVTGTAAQGGVTVFPRLAGHGSTDALCDELLDRRGVLLLPGSCFGMPSHVRLGFGGPTDALREGLSALAELL
jgi:capreomycidine synthase